MEVHYQESVQVDEVRTAIQSLGYTDFQVQNFGTSQDIMIRLPARDGQDAGAQSQGVMQVLQQQHSDAELRRVEFVGPQVGQELLHNGLMALLFVVAGILIRSEEHTSELQSLMRTSYAVFCLKK